MMIEDHRGRLMKCKSDGAQIGRDLARYRMRFVGVFLIIIAIVMLGYSLLEGMAVWNSAASVVALSIAISLLIAGFVFAIRRLAPVEEWVGRVVSGQCPSCGYDLRALPVDERDGCCVCPECGGAWRVTG